MSDLAFEPCPTPTPAGVGQGCLHGVLRHSHCQACVSACAYGAVTLMDGRARIDREACTACGACLFACPVGALDYPAPPRRHYRENRLVMPLSAAPPCVDELLMWHAEYRIRAVEMDMAHNPGWVVAVAALNLRLKLLNQPLWRIVTPSAAVVDSARRRWLHIEGDKKQTASVTPGRRARRACFPHLSDYQIALDPTRCFLCGACARFCPEGAINMNGQALTLHHTRCTGCGGCADVCFPQALVVTEGNDSVMTALCVREAQCLVCQQTFLAWDDQREKCLVCQRHEYGMREA